MRLIDAGHLRQRRRAAAPLEEFSLREPEPPQPSRPVWPAAPDVFGNLHQPIGVRVGQRSQQDRVDHAEDRGGRADAEGHGQHRCQREARMATKPAHRIGNVAPQILEPHKRAMVAVDLFRLIDATERPHCREAGLFRAQAATEVVLFDQGQMRRDLARHLSFGLAGSHERHEAPPEPAHGRHHGFSSKSLSTRPANRRHRSVCRSSARAPALVIE